jgi:nicotinamide-nucleotide amidase
LRPTKTKLDAEIVTIGDELNRGEIVDTNSSWLAERLTAIGLHVRYRSCVTDDAPDMVDALRRAAGRVDVVVCSGGLGPTDDDRTVDVVCGLLEVEAVEEPQHGETMRRRFAERNFAFTPNNLRQVRIPQGAEVLRNPTGLAPGFTVSGVPGPDGKPTRARLSFMPGPPREMRPMFDANLAPALAALVGDALQTAKRVFRIAGVGESHVDHALSGLMDGTHDTTLHFRIAFPENLVTLVVRRATKAEAEAELERLSVEVERRLGAHIYARDAETLPMAVGKRLVARGQTLALAESCTGGMLGALVTEAPGASRWFKGAVVAYSYELKSALLGVEQRTLATEGAVSAAVARQMAEGARTRLGTDWAIAITGIAGPDGGTAEKPVGTVWLAIAGPPELGGTREKKLFWPGDREQVRRMASVTALHLLYKTLAAESDDRSNRSSATPSS